jgi:hypothetical protein
MKIGLLIKLFVLAIVVLWFVKVLLPEKNQEEPASETSKEAVGTDHSGLFSTKRGVQTPVSESEKSTQVSHATFVETQEVPDIRGENPVDPVVVNQEREFSTPQSGLQSTNVLKSLLPEWVFEHEIGVHNEVVEVGGGMISRSRTRYAWDNGSGMEVELTDAGPNANSEQLAALGFDLYPVDPEETPEVEMELSQGEYLIYKEYTEESMEGSIQLVIHDRYLVEIKLSNLPLESFQVLLDQLSIDALIALAKESATE